jgi:hypothetical protein
MREHRHFNFPAFFAEEAKLQRLNWDVVNPARHDIENGWVTVDYRSPGGAISAVRLNDSFDFDTAIAWDLEQITTCRALRLLPGWEASQGANLEHDHARSLGLDIYYPDDDVPSVPVAATILGLMGVAGAGKDAAAAAIAEGCEFRHFAFADRLKELAYQSHPGVRKLVDRKGWEGAKRHRTLRDRLLRRTPMVRRYLQDLGVAVRQVIGEDTWVRLVMEQIRPGDSVVISDVRFLSEIDSLRSADGVLVRVDRPGTSAANEHISEWEWQQVTPDWAITNDGSLADFRSRAKALGCKLREEER